MEDDNLQNLEDDEEIKNASLLASSNDDNDDDNALEEAAEDNQENASDTTKKSIHAMKEVEKVKKEEIKKILSGLEALKSKLVSDAENASTDASMVKGQGQENSYLMYLLRQTELFAHFSSIRELHARTMTEAEEDAKFVQEEGCARGNRRMFVRPSCIKVDMKDFQLVGLNWLISLWRNGINGILADDKALDKILQTISLLGYLHEMKGITGPHMVVAPKSTLKNWMEQIKLICPVLRVAKFLDSSDKGLVTGEFDVCVTSFESVIKEKLAFRKFSWRYIIIDQVHRIKNENSILSQTMQKFKTNFRLLIIDTPLQNNVHELQSLIGFLLPEIFSSAEILGESDQQEKVVQQFHKVFRPFLLQRLESDIRNGVLEETILKVGMSQMQKQYYRAFLQKDKEVIHMALEQEDCVGPKWSIQRKRFLRTARQLLKCCNHPYLFAGAEFGCPYTTHEHLIKTAGKMILLDKLLPLLKDSKVILFSQMRRQLDIIEDYLNFRDYKYCRLDGNIVGDDHASIKALNAPSEKLVFLLSSRAGLDINLTTADVVILFDSNWYPQADLLQLKAHRIGETKKVCVYRFCTKSTIEEKVIERAYKMIACPTIKQEQLLELMRVSRGDLLQMIRFDVRELCSTMDTTITNEPIDKILDKREQKPPVLVDDIYDLLGYNGVGVNDRAGFQEICRVKWVEPIRDIPRPPRMRRMRRKRTHEQMEEDPQVQSNQFQD